MSHVTSITPAQQRYIDLSSEAKIRYARSTWAIGASLAILTAVQGPSLQKKFQARPLSTDEKLSFVILPVLIVMMSLLQAKRPPYNHLSAEFDCTSLRHVSTFKEFYQRFPKSILPCNNKFHTLFNYGIIDSKHRATLDNLYSEYESNPNPSIDLRFKALLSQIQQDLPSPVNLLP